MENIKKTKLGIIPSEWIVERLDKLIEQRVIIEVLDGNHGGLYPRSEEFIESGVPYISANLIHLNKVNFNKAKFLSEDRANKFKKGIAHNGDVLFAHNATVGPVALLETNENKVILSTSLTYYRVNSEIINNKYLMNYMSSHLFVKQYSQQMKQSTRNQVPITMQKQLFFIVPPLKEQEKIAEILSTWDLAIEKQEQLIEKKKEFKKGLMQSLLSGEIRFKEFTDKWSKVNIADIAEQVNNINKENKDYTVLSCTKYYGLVESLKYFGKQMFSDDISKYKIVKINEFAYATNHIEEGSIGVQRVCDIGLVSPMYTVFKTNNKIDIDFLFYLLKTDKYISIYKSRMSASVDRRGSLRWPEFSKIKLYLPSLEEQKKISEVLKSADKEIELLEKELEALKLQKKGLMQRLLTGEVRVKV